MSAASEPTYAARVWRLCTLAFLTILYPILLVYCSLRAAYEFAAELWRELRFGL